MKFLKLISGLGLLVIYFLFLCSSITITSCKKTNTVHDTTDVFVHDTTTLIKTDSIYDIKDGMVAYYNFNGGSLQDSSGFNNNIVFNNAIKTTDRFGNANNAYLFDGSSSYMQILNSP